IILVRNSRQRLEAKGLISLGARPGSAMALEIQYWTELSGDLGADAPSA
ncbi:MAG: hypothetical protein HQL66_12030, partial [Magnetococcales bacterium]|nr:hypothetical protein [Magnetococcales bacterium]